ncbi:MAG: SDR family NAD(P)-dependent oxidoreductase [Dongiaceae bacterium]
MLSPDGRAVMISGASRGIGRAIAERLGADGYQLSLGARDPAALRELVDQVPKGRAMVFTYEARNPQIARDWVRATHECFGRIDAVVANAGIMRPFTVEDGGEADLDAMWEVNAKAPWRLINAAFPYLKASGTGRVITIASMLGKRVKSARTTGYPMSKFAAMALTHGVRHSGWKHGIRATAICPGFVRTGMTVNTLDPAPDEMTQPESVATLVATVLALPNTAALPDLSFNCVMEP